MLPKAKEMRRRTPSVMRDPVEAARRVDPREGLRGGQLSRRDGGEDRGAMPALHGVQRLRRAFGLGERRADFRETRSSRSALRGGSARTRRRSIRRRSASSA